MKYMSTNLTKYDCMLKTTKQMKESKAPSKWGETLCSQVGKLNVAKMSLLQIDLKVEQKSNQKHYRLCGTNTRVDCKMYMEMHRTWSTQTNSEKNNSVETLVTS